MSSANDSKPDALVEYIHLIQKHGPDSLEATKFFEENKHHDAFVQNAKEQYLLEKEDFEVRRAKWGKDT